MRSTFSGLSAAISGLYANKKALDTVSHNIANVDNPYYVRQQVIQATGSYSNSSIDGFQMGTGVNIQEIRQIKDEFLDIKYRSHAEESGYWTTRTNVFEEIQTIFNELSDNGLQKVMDQFWNSWEELTKAPDSLTIRGLLHERAVSLVETVNHYAQQIDNLQVNLNEDIKNKIHEINDITKQIAGLNNDIVKLEARGIKANDYRDTRSSLIDRLSQLANISCSDDASGAVNILLGGQSLVNKSDYREISAVQNKSTFVDVYWKDTLTGGYTVNANSEKVNIQNGELKGLIDARGDIDTTILDGGNGTISDQIDVVFAVDLTSSNLADIEAAINSYRDDMKDRGLDVQIKLIGFDDNVEFDNGFLDLATFDSTNLLTLNSQPDTDESFANMIASVGSMAFRDGAQKKLVVFTDENIGGTGVNIDDTTFGNYITSLNDANISTTIVSNITDKYEGDAGEKGWNEIAHGTGGQFFDIAELTIDIDALAKDIAQESTDYASLNMGETGNFLEVIPSLRQKLNTFVNTIARNINYIHKQGKTLLGADGQDFFVASNSAVPIQAGNIKLNPQLNTLNNIAASMNGDKGDGRIAEQIADIRYSYIFGNMTGDDYYKDIISTLGVVAEESQRVMENQGILISQVDNNRKAITNVSLDEEMANMLQYQHSYVANSRVVNAIDEMIENIVNKMGITGR